MVDLDQAGPAPPRSPYRGSCGHVRGCPLSGAWASQPDMALLFAGLEPAASGEVIAALEQQGVPYEVRGPAVYVPSTQRDVLRMTLASEGLPQTAGQGYELLDSLTGFGTTAQMFDAAYLRAKEGELARTILASPGIRSGPCPHFCPGRSPRLPAIRDNGRRDGDVSGRSRPRSGRGIALSCCICRVRPETRGRCGDRFRTRSHSARRGPAARWKRPGRGTSGARRTPSRSASRFRKRCGRNHRRYRDRE